MSAAALLALVLAVDPMPAVQLVKPTADGPAVVEATGLAPAVVVAVRAAKPTSREWAAILRVVVAGGTPAEEAARPAVAGSYTVGDGMIRFEPQFPLVPGLEYRATFSPAKLPGGDPKAAPISATVSVPKPPPGPPTAVAAIYPTANYLPENALRLYVHLSGPMARGDVYRHFQLIRDDGVPVKAPFLELDEELWSSDGLRLTVLFHPGRVKRGLVPREQDGPVLEEGRRYTFVVSGEWKDATGRPLAAEVRKAFSVGPPDDAVVDPKTWAVIPPTNPGAPLIVRLAKPLDHALLGGMVWVTDAAGARVPGTVTVGGGERVVTFAPDRPWRKGDYRLVVDTRLEDVCGNRVGEPFEVDVFRPVERKIETKTVERPFTVR